MEATVNATTLALLTKSLNIFPTRYIARRLTRTYAGAGLHRRIHSFSSSSNLRRSLCLLDPPSRRRLHCVGSNHSSFAPGGGNGGLGGGNGRGHGGGGDSDGSGDAKSSVSVAASEGAAFSSDVIMLDVEGMTCGGCVASVKRILESRPEVSSASVNLTTEVAVVWPVPEAKLTPDWQQHLGETLAKHLTNCGFISNIRDSGRNSFLQIFKGKLEDKQKRLKESGRHL